MYGYNSSKYHKLLQCMSEHGCQPASPPDGVCPANDIDAVKNLTDMAQVKGEWWIIRGVSCGQSGWPAAFDYFPCQRDEFVQENGSWIDHIAYCGGRNNACRTPMCHTVANVSITSPGVMTHWYTDPPLKPQIEKWRFSLGLILTGCSTSTVASPPPGPYAGGSVVTRSGRTASDIPAYVEKEFRATAVQFGFNYDTMCISNVTNCSD